MNLDQDKVLSIIYKEGKLSAQMEHSVYISIHKKNTSLYSANKKRGLIGVYQFQISLLTSPHIFRQIREGKFACARQNEKFERLFESQPADASIFGLTSNARTHARRRHTHV